MAGGQLHMIDAIGEAVTAPDGRVLPLSQAVRAGQLLYVSGQLALRDGRIHGADAAVQTEVVLDNLEQVLRTAGAGLGHVIKTTIWLTRHADFTAFNAAYASRFTAPFPARATVVSDLVIPGALVEIEAVALLSD
jgi:2-iminobutanoate/2-iminopropanoate deaminase